MTVFDEMIELVVFMKTADALMAWLDAAVSNMVVCCTVSRYCFVAASFPSTNTPCGTVTHIPRVHKELPTATVV